MWRDSNQPSGRTRHDLNKSPDFLLCLTFDKNSARELEIIETDNWTSLVSDNLENIHIVCIEIQKGTKEEYGLKCFLEILY